MRPQGRGRGGEGKRVRKEDTGSQKSRKYLTKKIESRVEEMNQKSHKQRRLFFLLKD